MPGTTMRAEASISRTPAGAARAGPTAAMRSPSTSTSARARAGGEPARTWPPRMTMAMALLPGRQEVVGVQLLERHLPLQLEVLRVEVAGLFELGGGELADRHLPARDLLGEHEPRGDLSGADRAVGIDLRVVLEQIAHA